MKPTRAGVHPALLGELERRRVAGIEAELVLRRAFSRVLTLAFGAWMALDGLLFILSGDARLSSPVFTYPAEIIPGWPWPFAIAISAAGVMLVAAAVANRQLLAAIGFFIVSAWHFAYWLLIWRAIAVPTPGVRPVSYPPISDHGALSAVAFVMGLMLLRLWRQAHRERLVRRQLRGRAVRG